MPTMLISLCNTYIGLTVGTAFLIEVFLIATVGNEKYFGENVQFSDLLMLNVRRKQLVL